MGGQVTQLIARRVREGGVYSEIVPVQNAEKVLKTFDPKAIILSGGPASVTWEDSPRAPMAVFDMGVPVLGICYGQQAMCAAARRQGRKLRSPRVRPRPSSRSWTTAPCSRISGRSARSEQVWMSHGDRVVALPEGFKVVGTSDGAPFAAIAE